MGRCGGGKSFGKFSSFCYIYYAYALYKPQERLAN